MSAGGAKLRSSPMVRESMEQWRAYGTRWRNNLVIVPCANSMSRWQPLTQAVSAPLFSAADAAKEAGILPRDVIFDLCDQLPIPDLVNAALVSRSFCAVVRDDHLWEQRWKRLGWTPINGMKEPLLDTPITPPDSASLAKVPSEQEKSSASSRPMDLLADLEFDTAKLPHTNAPYFIRVKHAYIVLLPYAKSLATASSASSSLLFTRVTDVIEQYKLATILTRFVSPLFGGVRDDAIVCGMRSALDYIHGELLAEFRKADNERKTGNDATAAISRMSVLAHLVWDSRIVSLYVGHHTPSMGHASERFAAIDKHGGSLLLAEFVKNIDVATKENHHDPSLIVVQVGEPLDLSQMQSFIDFLCGILAQETTVAQKVFPADQHPSHVLLDYVASGVLRDYVTALLARAKDVSDELYLQAFSRSLSLALQMADGLDQESREIVAGLWNHHLDEYVSTETSWLSLMLRAQCDQWAQTLEELHQQHRDAQLLSAPPSAAQKRTFISTFKSALLKPVSFNTSASTKTDVSQTYASDAAPGSTSSMQMSSLLNLNTAVELINTTRLTLQRLETLKKTNTPVATQVQPAIDLVVVKLFAVLDDYHLKPGFARAREQIANYRPADHDTDAPIDSKVSAQIAPLVLFFDLVHIGDTIQQMMQVFFDEVATHLLSAADFTNAAVREKKRFENDLDDNVAEGLSAGVALLIQHVEHIVLTHQSPRDFYPEQGQYLDLSKPTKACSECVSCLRISCVMLASCTDKTVLDLFYEEIGLRLHAVLCKHLKKQIVSLSGGFQVIADLNEYYNFISTLKQPQLTALFAALKRVGSIFIVDDPKELAKMVRDASLSQGTLRPEELYELLRARCDFKSIERSIDAELYGFKMVEDCVVM